MEIFSVLGIRPLMESPGIHPNIDSPGFMFSSRDHDPLFLPFFSGLFLSLAVLNSHAGPPRHDSPRCLY